MVFKFAHLAHYQNIKVAKLILNSLYGKRALLDLAKGGK